MTATEFTPARPLPRPLLLTFTASGSEYFRIWVVNLLLIVVTLGFYIPFAKARRLQYFYANTLLDGQALSFHGDPWRMLRGYVLMVMLFGGYSLSGHFSAWAALGVFVLLALLWPALWRSSMRFRLYNTSWRGLRFGFAGSVSQAYQAMLPLFVPSLVFVAANAWYLGGVDRSDRAATNAAVNAEGPVMLFGLALLALLFPYGLSQLKRYQHQGYCYADQHTEFNAATKAFFKLGLKALGLYFLALVLLIFVLALGYFVYKAMANGSGHVGAFLLSLLAAAVYVAFISMMIAYLASRLQNLCWNATRSRNLEFKSELKAWGLTHLTLRNFCFTLITLGFYRPFAVVNTIAYRLAAVQAVVDSDIDTWQASGAQGTHATSGEMAGDFFGIDMGL
jgi:uncharacterized membrane protein YjgN (DUF898 family)